MLQTSSCKCSISIYQNSPSFLKENCQMEQSNLSMVFFYVCFLISISQEGRLYFCGVSKSLLGGLDFATFWYFLLSQKVAPQVHIFCFRRNWRLKLWELELKGYFVISINEALLLYLVKKITFVVCLSEQPLDNFCFRRKRLILI